MTEYNKRSIYNKILKVLSEGKNQNDARGVDVALLYQPDLFRVISADFITPA